MNDEKKLSDDEMKDIAGGAKNFNSSKSNTSKISGDGTKEETKPGFSPGAGLDSGGKGK
jgi:hypothetical protein